MVANLSAHKKGWESRWEEFSKWAEKGQRIKDELLKLVDEDTRAFNRIMESFSLPKNSDEEKKSRTRAIQDATMNAIEVPLRVMELAFESFDLIEAMAKEGNPNSVSDAGVGALCARSAVLGAYLNVTINVAALHDEDVKNTFVITAETLKQKAIARENEILKTVMDKINSL